MIRLLSALIALSILFLSRGAQADIQLQHGNTDGHLLLSELACTACHDPGAARAQFLPHTGPNLSAVASRALPAAIRAMIEDPAHAKPGTIMPSLLSHLSPEDRAAAAENLTHYLASLAPPLTTQATGVSEAAIKRGQNLYHTIGCVACHAPFVAPPADDTDEEKDPAKRPIPKLESASLPLGDLASKYTLDSLAAFLLNPLACRPSGRMPSLALSPSESADLSAYLLRDQLDKKSPLPARGLRFAYYEGEFKALKDLNRLKPIDQGTALDLTAAIARRKNEFALKFTGELNLSETGKYGFEIDSDEPIDLKIDNKIVPLPKPDSKKRPTIGVGAVTLKKGKHPIEITYRHNEGPASLKASWNFIAQPLPSEKEDAGIDSKKPNEKKDADNKNADKKSAGKKPADKKNPDADPPTTPFAPIPASALSHPGFKMLPHGDLAIKVDPTKSATGQSLFKSVGCAACHAIDGVPASKSAKPLLALDPSASGACLDSKPAAGHPLYALSAPQRQALSKALTDLKTNPNEDPKLTLARNLSALNCFACHSRESAGGPEPLRAAYFTPIEELDLGDEGRIPPHLNEVGAKLNLPAIQKILDGDLRVRPYMATRMPNFGHDNTAHLPALFTQLDAAKIPALPVQTAAVPAAFQARQIDDGRKLVGVNGLGCVQCHAWGNLKSLGLPSVNLSAAPERLTPSYFHAYLLEPNKYRPGTRMPPFWAPGVHVAPEIQSGDPDKQITAIWAYLSAGTNAGMPAGMEPSDKTMLIPVDEPIVFRTFIDKQGAHGIAVGFRQKSHVLFDAMQVRMAAAWPGDFLKSDGAWNGRGGNYTPLPSTNILNLPAGPAFALLESQTTPWPTYDPTKHLAPENFKFTGYRYDKARNPTFLYTFNNIQIEETPSAIFSPEGKGHIIRKLHLTSNTEPKDLWFRVITGKEITTTKPSQFIIDTKTQLTLTPNNPDTTIRAINDPKTPTRELVTPIKWTPKPNSPGFESDLEIELTW